MYNALYACPICKEELFMLPTHKSFECPAHHTFDIAKQGYVNLIPTHQKSSKNPGDSKEMVLARRTFLQSGFYKPLSDQVIATILETHKLINRPSFNVLDVGCGEGYYTNNLRTKVLEHNIPVYFYGMDISKEAVKLASSSSKDINWCVGNSFHLPYKQEAFHCLLSIFSPLDLSECCRVLQPDGFLFRVLPGPEHLLQIREIIYDEVLSEMENYAVDQGQLTFISMTPVTYTMTLKNDALLDLIQMTPHYWHTSKEAKKPLELLDELEVTLDMQIFMYQKK